jgi:hypothetical protein
MELTLKSGKTITVDISELTVSEWRNFTTARGTVKDENAVISKCTGLKVDEIESMAFQEFRRVVQTIVKLASEPLADPN